MPFKDSKYIHIRRQSPEKVQVEYTVPISHTNATKKYPEGTIARIGRSPKTGDWIIQAILIPKKRK